MQSEESKKAKGGTSSPCVPTAERYSPQVARSQSSRGNFFIQNVFCLYPCEKKERKPASSNTFAYIIHGSRLIGGVKGPRALVRSFASNQWCGGGRKIPQVAAAYAGWRVEFAARRLAVGPPWLKLEPCSPNTRREGGRAERPSIKTAPTEREPNAAPDETPLSEMARA